MTSFLTRSASAVVLAGAALTANAAQPFLPLAPAHLLGQSAFLLLLAADASQTRQIASFCTGRTGCTLHEANPLLGPAPSPARIRNYFLAAAVAHTLVTLALAPSGRSAWLAGSLALEAVVVGRNKSLGLRVKF